jgi:hypothetical protein
VSGEVSFEMVIWRGNSGVEVSLASVKVQLESRRLRGNGMCQFRTKVDADLYVDSPG